MINLDTPDDAFAAVFESAFAAAPVGLGVFDFEGRYLRVNAELAQINGLSPEAHIGRTVLEILKDMGHEVLRIIRHVHETGDTVRDVEMSGETPREPGVPRYWLCGFFPIRRDGGPVEAVGVWVAEITERKRAEQELQASRLKLQMGIQAAGLVMAEIDYRTNLNHISAELARLLELGDGPTVVPRQAIFDRIHPEDRERYLQAIARTVDPNGNGLLAIDVRALLPDGTVRWLHIRLQVSFAMIDGQLRPDRGICAARDVTAEMQAQRELHEADRRKDAFIATLAHELRNPLAPIRTGLEILRRAGELPPPAARTRDMMERQLTHMVRLVDDLLDVSRINRDKLELRLAPVTLQEVVEHAMEASRPAAEAAGHGLTVTLPQAPVRLNGDLTRLAQVVSNLVQNASRYTPPGGRIAVRGEAGPAWAVLTVEDNGSGIAPEVLPHLFNMFSQGDRPRHGAQGGLGIGLWLVKKLVELHHGMVEARSEGVGRGSRFVVRLPLARE
jgi:PAS domain S-box-containing protein